jgi:hypothetical protein
MYPGETVRAECTECLLGFSIHLAQSSEWPGGQAAEYPYSLTPTHCPFCGCEGLHVTTAPDEPVVVKN